MGLYVTVLVGKIYVIRFTCIVVSLLLPKYNLKESFGNGLENLISYLMGSDEFEQGYEFYSVITWFKDISHISNDID